VMGEVREAQAQYLGALGELIKYQQALANGGQDVGGEVASAGLMMLIVAAIAGALGVFIAWFVTVSVTRPLNEAVGITDRIADGDLTATIRASSTDEVGHLLSSLQKMQANLQKIVGEVRTGVDSVSTASQQIAAGNQDLSSRTEEQASNLQQTAASMEQLAATVRQNTETAKQANTLAASASSAAAKGGSVVGDVVNTMEGISAASHKIADIINVIDGIAFQTNILALNAAVEAARAGEQGRGFAVVAGEVRNLAQRSAQAAREIKSLISDSVEKVDAGGKLVHQAGDAMQDIVAQVKRVSDLIGEITSATLEQNSGIGQVNNAVTQLDQVTQQNAALVEESAAAAESMKAQAHKLAQSVSVFRLSQAQAHEVIAQAQGAARRGWSPS
jgi:methyl-accepting chemotaxis protein